MFEMLFKCPAARKRHREGPLVHARQQFLEDCERRGYSRTMLEKIAWVLLSLAPAFDSKPGRLTNLDIDLAVDDRKKFHRSGTSIEREIFVSPVVQAFRDRLDAQHGVVRGRNRELLV